MRWTRRALAVIGAGSLFLACHGEPVGVASPPPSPPPPSAAPAPSAPPQPREAPAPTETAGAARRRVVISAAGDLVPNAMVMRAVRAGGDEAAGYRAFLGGWARSIGDEDIAYVNLEVPLADDVVPLDRGAPRGSDRPQHPPVLGASPTLARVLAEIGVDVVGVANNHAYDQDHDGLRRTLEALDEAGVPAIGAAADEDGAYAPRVIERGGTRIAWLAATGPLNRAPRDRASTRVARLTPIVRLLQALAEARARADVVVVAAHWSTDFVLEAGAEQRTLARTLIDGGADIVIGTGPHVLQEVERIASPRGDGVIAYSLGNVASGMGRSYRIGRSIDETVHPAISRPEGREGLVLRIAIAIDDQGRIGIERVEGVALWTENDFLDHRDEARASIRAMPLDECAPEVRAERLPAIRAALGDAVELVGI